MELRQLEYFLAVAETGSFNKSSKILYTTQPNVSKVIKALEADLGVSLFERNSKGVVLTPTGEKMYDYARNILQNANAIQKIARLGAAEKFSISSFPSMMVAGVFRRFYLERIDSNRTQAEFLEGTAETIMENVSCGKSQIGILYYNHNRDAIFHHILGHKNLEFHLLERCRLCLYVGKSSPWYGAGRITQSQLQSIKYIQLPKDFFSVDHDLNMVSVGQIQMNNLFHAVTTNSDNLLADFLKTTDTAYLGLYLINDNYRIPDLSVVEVEGFERDLSLGYVKKKDHSLPGETEVFISYVQTMIKNSRK
ncbi:MAG: LysR family transcriptional regulator [Spirochaetales bacterium]|nr:LysR family transcriptional regulator [Spirochaetales bacterium]